MHREKIINLGGMFNYIGKEILNLYKMVSKKIVESITLILTNSTGDDLIDYKIYGNSKQESTLLPSGYTQVDYIESSNRNQYINTNVVPASTQKYQIKYSVDDVSTNQTIFGSRTNGGYQTSTNQIYIGNQVNYYYQYVGTQGIGNIPMDANTVYEKEILANSGNFDDTATQPFYLFALNNQGSTSVKANMKLYYCKIYDNNVLIRNFVPCYRNSDNEVGLYDLVNNVFYINQGTGNFTYGRMPSPENPQELKSVGDLVESGEHQGKYKIPVICSGKNRFNVEIESGTYSGGGGKTANSKRLRTASPLYLEGGTYTLSCKETFSAIVYASNTGETNSYSQLINAYSSMPYTFTLSENKYILIAFNNDNTELTPSDISEIQLEEGITATGFEPYYEPIITNIYLDEPLRKIGDVKDYIDFKNGKRINKICKKILNGSETWTARYIYTNTVRLDGELLTGGKVISENKIITDKFLSLYGNTTDTEHIRNGDSSYPTALIVYINKDRIDNPTTTASAKTNFISWLSLNNVTVYYVLETPTEESVTLPDIPTFEGTTIITFGSEINPSNAWVQYYAEEE